MKKYVLLIASLAIIFGCNQTKSAMKDTQKVAIENYISSYNSFDVDGMIKDLSHEVVFENISEGQVDMKLEGLEAFKEQATAATNYFSEREQEISSWNFQDEIVSVDIEYVGILAIELPNGMKPGDTLKLKGKSTFVFSDNKIVKITDES